MFMFLNYALRALFVVSKGNPKQIKDRNDLIGPGGFSRT